MTDCSKCKYYYGKHNLNCAPHPSGPLDDSCSDFQLKYLNSIESREQNAQSNKYWKAVGKDIIFLLMITIPLGVAIGLYKEVSLTKKLFDKNSAVADQYKDEFNKCYQFIENAGNAGTTKIAQTELAKSMSWLQDNYPKDRFEYKDLNADLTYLKSLPSESVVPLPLKSSIKNDLEVVENTVNGQVRRMRERGNTDWLFFWFLIESLGLFIALFICLIVGISLFFIICS